MLKLRKTSRGMTLTEIMVAVALFGILSLMVTNLIISSSQSYTMGRERQNLRNSVSYVLQNMKLDISRSYLLPARGGYDSNSNIFSNVPRIPSPVILPNCYGYDSGIDGDLGGGRSENRLIMSVPRRSMDDPDFYNKLVDYNDGTLRFVEYVVPNAQLNTIYRRTYKIRTNSLTGYDGYRANIAQMKWTLDDSYFKTGAGNMISDQIMAQLPGIFDVINFTVQRPQLSSPNYQYGSTINFDPYHMEINLVMTSYQNDDKSKQYMYEEQTTASIVAR